MYELRGVSRHVNASENIIRAVVFDSVKRIYHTLVLPVQMSYNAKQMRLYIGEQMNTDIDNVTIAPHLSIGK